MRVLITGAAGFVGRYMAENLEQAGHVPLALDVAFPGPGRGICERLTVDLQDAEAVNAAVRATKPDACIHLAALSFVPQGISAPERMLSVNVLGTLTLLDAFRAHAPAAKILTVSSAQVYGMGGGAREQALKETDPLAPTTLYAVTKAAADLATLAYAGRHEMHTMTVRPNNHTGPGQATHFAVPSFIGQIKAIRRGATEPVIVTGNLMCTRDFADVRDVVEAYRLLLETGRTGKAYNLAARNRLKMGDILNALCRLADVEVQVREDPERYRPTDESPMLDTTELRRDTGWSPRHPFDRTLRDMLEAP